MCIDGARAQSRAIEEESLPEPFDAKCEPTGFESSRCSGARPSLTDPPGAAPGLLRYPHPEAGHVPFTEVPARFVLIVRAVYTRARVSLPSVSYVQP